MGSPAFYKRPNRHKAIIPHRKHCGVYEFMLLRGRQIK